MRNWLCEGIGWVTIRNRCDGRRVLQASLSLGASRRAALALAGVEIYVRPSHAKLGPSSYFSAARPATST